VTIRVSAIICASSGNRRSDSRIHQLNPSRPKGEQPGTINSLYAGVSRDGDLGTPLAVEVFKSGHGRQPGTLKALAAWREKQATAASAPSGLRALGVPAETIGESDRH
jgi:hypothetical protein